ncbi:MAG TPA: type II toxin-antitoxin system VapC family toxin [Burkholderiaceae bacterium]|nr:type II toxin-antitoxin system VapC family toxin [Burkholderiaceae bacterium]HNB46830.1 type II toxin-antitoxin system VapC family toxin [Burkholderiaceae bacterium]HNG80232.1 type II toxin-antitoxin system VapC family toxin [Burkholderiaceae bacterium]
MTPGPFVVDASVAAAWFLPDEATPFTEAALNATAGGGVWVPALWRLEIGNLLLGAERRRRITSDKRVELVALAAAVRLQVDREPVDMVALDALAARHGLTTYDASYLELALRRRLPLATLDKALLAAMLSAGVAPANLVAGAG